MQCSFAEWREVGVVDQRSSGLTRPDFISTKDSLASCQGLTCDQWSGRTQVNQVDGMATDIGEVDTVDRAVLSTIDVMGR